MIVKNTHIGNVIFALFGVVTFLYMLNLGIKDNRPNSIYEIILVRLIVWNTFLLVALTLLFKTIRTKIVNNNIYNITYNSKGENLINSIRPENITLMRGCILTTYWLSSACLGLLGGGTACRLVFFLFPNSPY
jgi:hypothetical protein